MTMCYFLQVFGAFRWVMISSYYIMSLKELLYSAISDTPTTNESDQLSDNTAASVTYHTFETVPQSLVAVAL